MEGWERFTRAMAIARTMLGAFVSFTPGLALKVYRAPEGSNTATFRYVVRMFGIRNAELGFALWQVRRDPKRVRQMATLNACIEGLDAIAGITPLVRRDGMDRAAVAALATSFSVGTSFLILRRLTPDGHVEVGALGKAGSDTAQEPAGTPRTSYSREPLARID